MNLDIQGSPAALAKIHKTLDLFPQNFVQAAVENRTHIVVCPPGKTYASVSPHIKRERMDFDNWRDPPTGLFVTKERTIYLRNVDALTIAHEFGHAIDCAFGKGIYYSFVSCRIEEDFAQARNFVTPYANYNVNEYFAECLRAYIGINNRSYDFPAVSPKKLKRCSPYMYSFFDHYAKHGKIL